MVSNRACIKPAIDCTETVADTMCSIDCNYPLEAPLANTYIINMNTEHSYVRCWSGQPTFSTYWNTETFCLLQTTNSTSEALVDMHDVDSVESDLRSANIVGRLHAHGLTLSGFVLKTVQHGVHSWLLQRSARNMHATDDDDTEFNL